jgi:hypothetical protein
MRSDRVNLALLLAAAVLGANGVRAADLDVCAALPISKVTELVHQTLTGVRAEVSEEAHSFSCAYGMGGLISGERHSSWRRSGLHAYDQSVPQCHDRGRSRGQGRL